jgi:hypothetical protein
VFGRIRITVSRELNQLNEEWFWVNEEWFYSIFYEKVVSGELLTRAGA